MWMRRTLVSAAGLVAALFACEGPRVGPPLAGAGGDASDEVCEDHCARGAGCDRDCVHACEVGMTLCLAEWAAALGCGSAPRCDPSFGLPTPSQGCEDEFMVARDCADHGSCSAESSFELCHACCAGWEIDGAVLWQSIFHECLCAECAAECGAECGSNGDGAVACESCAAAFCDSEVTATCRADFGCNRYDVCVTGCPLDASSHCNEHATFAGCYDCCVRDFTAGAERYGEALTECACGLCSEACLDSELCEGFDIVKPSCEACIESTCEPVLAGGCGSEPACASFMACFAACPP